MNYLVVQKSDGLVVNVIVWDSESEYNQNDCELILASDEPDGVWVGWKLIDGQWIAPIVEVIDTPDESIEQ